MPLHVSAQSRPQSLSLHLSRIPGMFISFTACCLEYTIYQILPRRFCLYNKTAVFQRGDDLMYLACGNVAQLKAHSKS